MLASSSRSVRGSLIVLTLLLLASLPNSLWAQGGKINTPDKLEQREESEREQRERDRVQARAAWWAARHQAIAGHTPSEMRLRAYQQKMQLREFNRQLWHKEASLNTKSAAGPVLPSSTPAFNQSWTHLGPRAIGPFNSNYGAVTGRIQSVAIDQGDATGNTVYVGAAGGGVWKSTNAANATPGNVTWTALTDDQASLVSNAIAIKPGTTGSSAVVIVGTGEPDFAGDSYYGAGFLRSTDGGATWTNIPTANSGVIALRGMGVSKIAFSASNTNLVVAGFSNGTAATFGSNTSPHQGIYFSTDAGATWTKANVPSGDTITGSVTDVAFNSSNVTGGDDKFYAVFRKQGVYSSSDGQNWIRLAAQPNLVAGCDTGTPSCPAGRGAIATRGNFIYYIAMDAGLSVYEGMWRYSISGGTWTQLDPTTNACTDNLGNPKPCITTTQGFYDLYLFAAPNTSVSTNTDLYIGTVDIFKCSNANMAAANSCGPSVVNLTDVYGANPLSVHPDQHGADFLANGSLGIVGNDGGVNRLSNPGSATQAASWQNLNANIGSLSQFVSMSQHPTDVNTLLGGLQDNGSPERDSTNAPGNGGTTWVQIEGGDGGYNAIDQTNPINWYSAFIAITITQCPVGDTSGGCILGAGNPVICSANGIGYLGSCVFGRNIPDEGAFYTPYILDPANQAKIIIGTCRVWRGNADGTGWSNTFGNVLSNQLPGNTTIGACGGGDVNALAAGGPASGGVSQVIYAGLTNGDVWKTTNAAGGTATWSKATGISPGGFPVGSVYMAPNDATGQTVYATIQGFLGTPAGHVWKSTNAGASWTDISGNLPDAPADAIALDPGDPTNNTVYVGNDQGIFYTTDGGATWVEYGPASGAGTFPDVAVTSLLVFNNGGNHFLRASTYGRGVWQNALQTFTVPDYSISLTGSPLTILPGFTGALNGTVTPIGGYTGSVTLSCNAVAPATCSANPNPRVIIGSTAVPFSLNVSNPSPGSFNITVHGTDGVLAHDSATQTVNVGTFTLTPAPNPATSTVKAGSTATYTISVTGNNWGLPVTLSCSGVPSLTGCGFATNPLTPNSGTVTTTFTIGTTAPTVAQPALTPTAQNRGGNLGGSFGALALTLPPVFGALLIGFRKPSPGHKRARTLLWLGLVLLLVLMMPACGGGGGGGGNNNNNNVIHSPGTPPGTYMVTITGSSGGTTQTTTVQLTVQ